MKKKPVKIRIIHGTLKGVLDISSNGVRFIPPNAKKPSPNKLSWDQLEAAITFGK